MRRIVIIQYLRAVAALGVAVFHVTGALPGAIAWWPGRYGVDLFFAISGFVMVYSTTAVTTPWDFMRHRLVRIVPLYFVTTTAAFLIANNFPSAMHHLVVTVPGYIHSVLFIPYTSPPILGQGWTLNYEMFFYLLFAATLSLPRETGLTVCLTALVVLTLAGLIHSATNPILVMATSWRLLEFGLGMALAMLSARRPRLLAAVDQRVPRIRLWALLGDASYSIYLSYPFVLAITGRLWRHVPVFAGSYAAFAVVAMAACVAGGVATYRLVERPLLDLFGGRPWARLRPAPG